MGGPVHRRPDRGAFPAADGLIARAASPTESPRNWGGTSVPHSQPIGHLLPGGYPHWSPGGDGAGGNRWGADGKVAYEHIDWDQAGLLGQLDLLDPAGLPIAPNTASQILALTRDSRPQPNAS